MKKVINLADRLDSGNGLDESGLGRITTASVIETLPDNVTAEAFTSSMQHARAVSDASALIAGDLAKPFFNANPSADNVSVITDIADGFSNEVIVSREGNHMQTRMQTSIQYENFEAVRQRGWDNILNEVAETEEE